MRVTLEQVQFKFASIIGELCGEPDILSQFAVWVDLRLAEYKLKGSISLDCSGDTPDPIWLQGILSVLLRRKQLKAGRISSVENEKNLELNHNLTITDQKPCSLWDRRSSVHKGFSKRVQNDTGPHEDSASSPVSCVFVKSEPEEDDSIVHVLYNDEGSDSPRFYKEDGSPTAKHPRLRLYSDHNGSEHNVEQVQDVENATNQSLLSIIGNTLPEAIAETPCDFASDREAMLAPETDTATKLFTQSSSTSLKNNTTLVVTLPFQSHNETRNSNLIEKRPDGRNVTAPSNNSTVPKVTQTASITQPRISLLRSILPKGKKKQLKTSRNTEQENVKQKDMEQETESTGHSAVNGSRGQSGSASQPLVYLEKLVKTTSVPATDSKTLKVIHSPCGSAVTQDLPESCYESVPHVPRLNIGPVVPVLARTTSSSTPAKKVPTKYPLKKPSITKYRPILPAGSRSDILVSGALSVEKTNNFNIQPSSNPSVSKGGSQIMSSAFLANAGKMDLKFS